MKKLKLSIFNFLLLFNFLFLSFMTSLTSQSCLTFSDSKYVRIGTSLGNDIGNGDFTIEATINGSESISGHHTIMSNRSSLNSGFHFAVHNYWGGSNYKMLMIRYGEINHFILNNGTYNGSLLDNQCHAVAISKKGTQLYFYVDGNLFGSRTTVENFQMGSTSALLIGRDSYSSNNFNGVISDVRIWNTFRSDDEILDGFENGISGNEDNLLAYWKMDDGNGQILENTTGTYEASLGNTTSNDSNDPIWTDNCCVELPKGECLTFEGKQQQVKIDGQFIDNIGSGDFTMEATIIGYESGFTHETILSNRSSTNTGFHLAIHDYWGGSNYKMLMIRYGGTNYMFVDNGQFNGIFLDGTCRNIAVTKKSAILSLYIDGVLIGTKTIQPNIDISTSNPLLIGGDAPSLNSFNGIISNVRIWNVSRTNDEIIAAIDNGVSLNENGLLAYWPLNEIGSQKVTDIAGGNHGYLGLNANTENIDPSWGGFCCSSNIVNIEDYFTNSKNLLDISVFPNPSTDIFYIVIADEFDKTTAKYTIYDVSGKLMKTGELIDNSINLLGFSAGKYYLELTNNSGQRAGGKLILIQ